MSSNVLLKILNFRENKNSYSVSERKKMISSYRADLHSRVVKAGNVLEDLIDEINNS